MIRTQISMSEDEYESAKSEARRLGISLAELVRRSLRSAISVRDAESWMRYAGLVETGDSDAGQHIDDVVFGHRD